MKTFKVYLWTFDYWAFVGEYTTETYANDTARRLERQTGRAAAYDTLIDGIVQ